MVCVGESITLPPACELVATLRVVEPAVAVIVTDMAFVLCQLKVTLCPEIIEVGLADNAIVGVLWPEPISPQPQSPARANGITLRMTQRTNILSLALIETELARDQMPSRASVLVFNLGVLLA